MSLAEHQKHMREALTLAKQAAASGEIPVGAVVVQGGNIIGSGRNRREELRDPTAHAELLAMRQAAHAIGDWRLTGCMLYVTLEPCPMCAGALAMARPDAIVYGARDSKMGCCGSVYDIAGDTAFGTSIPWLGDVLAQECAQLLKDFFVGKRQS